jgi:hypothetical protein
MRQLFQQLNGSDKATQDVYGHIAVRFIHQVEYCLSVLNLW